MDQLIYPILTFVLLTLVVWLRMFYERLVEMREHQIHPQSLSTSIEVQARLKSIKASDNFKNLCEAPILFYVLILLSLAIEYDAQYLITGSWIYVILRGAHSIIQCSYNNVYHRFFFYMLSSLVLFTMWGIFSYDAFMVQ